VLEVGRIAAQGGFVPFSVDIEIEAQVIGFTVAHESCLSCRGSERQWRADGARGARQRQSSSAWPRVQGAPGGRDARAAAHYLRVPGGSGSPHAGVPQALHRLRYADVIRLLTSGLLRSSGEGA